ncbi:MAG: acyl carrier protein [Bacteroidaceae bacterium]|nr:acyl carrier protein [Bacteroidaceae bacterium]
MTDVKEFVTEYIQREYTVPEDVDIMTLNYIEAGYIDSMGYIQFISTIEDEFDIDFEVEDIENPDMRIVGKLIDFINSKINA